MFEGVPADRPLGPGPAPGGRIVVEAPQLTAIARQFGVDWRSASPADRAVLERPGRPLSREDVIEPLRAALDAAGAPRDADLELGTLTAPPLPTGVTPQVEVVQTELDAVSGRFSALLTVSAEGMPATQVRLTGSLQEMADLPILRRRMMPGDVIAPADLQWARVRSRLAQGDVVRLPAQAVGLALRQSVAAGQPVQLSHLGRPLVVQKGMTLLLSLDGPGIQLTAQGVAAEPGGIGDRIRVLNPLSKVSVVAEITAPGRARVQPGAPTLAQVAVR